MLGVVAPTHAAEAGSLSGVVTQQTALDLVNQGLEQTRAGDYQAALASYTQALQLDPNNAYAYGNRGALRISLRDTEGAVADLQRAAELFLAEGNQASAQSALDAVAQLQS